MKTLLGKTREPKYAAKLISIRRTHYHETLREQIKRSGHLILIVFVFTSILILLALGALIQNVVLEQDSLIEATSSLILLQILGLAWVIPQNRAITGTPYQRFIDSLPLESQQTLRVNLSILAEANALFAVLWIAAIILIVRNFNSPLAISIYTLRTASVAILVLATQYAWLWRRRPALSLACLILFDAGLVAAMYFTRSVQNVSFLTSVIILNCNGECRVIFSAWHTHPVAQSTLVTACWSSLVEH